jgi:hypothetical protein
MGGGEGRVVVHWARLRGCPELSAGRVKRGMGAHMSHPFSPAVARPANESVRVRQPATGDPASFSLLSAVRLGVGLDG